MTDTTLSALHASVLASIPTGAEVVLSLPGVPRTFGTVPPSLVASGSVSAGTAGTLAYYSANGSQVAPLALGTNLSITAGVLNAVGGNAGTGSVNAGTSGTIAFYPSNGTAVSPLTLDPTIFQISGTTLSLIEVSVPALVALPGGAQPGDVMTADRSGSDYKLDLAAQWTFGKTVRVLPQGVVYSSGGNTIDLSTGNTFYLGATASIAADGTPTVTGTSGNVSLVFTGISAAIENQEIEIYIFHGASVGTVSVTGTNVAFTGGASTYTPTAGANGISALVGKIINQKLGITGLRWL